LLAPANPSHEIRPGANSRPERLVALSLSSWSVGTGTIVALGPCRRTDPFGTSLTLRKHPEQSHHPTLQVLVNVTVKEPSADIVGNHIRFAHRHGHQAH